MPDEKEIRKWMFARNLLLARLGNDTGTEAKRVSVRFQRFLKPITKPENKTAKKLQQQELKFWLSLAKKCVVHLPSRPRHYPCYYTPAMDDNWFMFYSGLVQAPLLDEASPNDIEAKEEESEQTSSTLPTPQDQPNKAGQREGTDERISLSPTPQVKPNEAEAQEKESDDTASSPATMHRENCLTTKKAAKIKVRSPDKTCREDAGLPLFSPSKLAAIHLVDMNGSIVC
mmetsp:Transcript_18312/g.60158  ORF Transcript_18312/g.60158 Transcript_18312/m.60158 type:complete len:229 (-) Transcript_18312:215-901(-)